MIYHGSHHGKYFLSCRFIIHHFFWTSLVAQLVKESACTVGDLGWRPGFDPWVGKIPWRRERLPTPVFWLGESRGVYSPRGHKESDTTEWILLHFTSLCSKKNLWDKHFEKCKVKGLNQLEHLVWRDNYYKVSGQKY